MTCIDEIVRNDNAALLECIYQIYQPVLAKRNLKELGSFSLLHLAAGNNGSKCLKFLLESGTEYSNQICNEQDRATPLHFAVLSNNYDNARFLLKHGANPNAKDSVSLPFRVIVSNFRVVTHQCISLWQQRTCPWSECSMTMALWRLIKTMTVSAQ